ncbi:hypothetical protein BD413DRAFT_305663 [Trametes elegans]|nr:hypothetical protein BD413DRAFT_305663 [Trametes elegans]
MEDMYPTAPLSKRFSLDLSLHLPSRYHSTIQRLEMDPVRQHASCPSVLNSQNAACDQHILWRSVFPTAPSNISASIDHTAHVKSPNFPKPPSREDVGVKRKQWFRDYRTRHRVSKPHSSRRRIVAIRYQIRRAFVGAWKCLTGPLQKPRYPDEGDLLDDFVLVELESHCPSPTPSRLLGDTRSNAAPSAL